MGILQAGFLFPFSVRFTGLDNNPPSSPRRFSWDADEPTAEWTGNLSCFPRRFLLGARKQKNLFRQAILPIWIRFLIFLTGRAGEPSTLCIGIVVSN